mgnify:CR=1 FL=1
MIEKGAVHMLADLVDYREGSVVSRTIFEKQTGSLTLFAFDRGQGLSEHTSPYDATVQVLEGRAEIAISGKPQSLGAGDIVVMPAGQPHSLRATERFKMLLTMIRSGE